MNHPCSAGRGPEHSGPIVSVTEIRSDALTTHQLCEACADLLPRRGAWFISRANGRRTTARSNTHGKMAR